MIAIISEAIGLACGSWLIAIEPEHWRARQRDIWTCCQRKTWTPRPYGGHQLFAGEMRLSTSDQRDRERGWVWYATLEHCEESLAQAGGFSSEVEARAAAIAFVRTFCAAAVGALPEGGA